MMKNRQADILVGLVFSLLSSFAFAQQPDKDQSLSEKVQVLKEQVLELNRDLFILEEDLLFPATTQVAVFLSVDTGVFFALDAVELKIDGQTVTHYLYTERQLDALHRGGVQRLYLGNLRTGEHEISAFFTGRSKDGRDFRRASTRKFQKTTDGKMLEIKIVDSTADYQADFSIVEWD